MERIHDNGNQNTIVLPAAGNGHDYIYGNVFNNGDTFDPHSLLAGTNWDGAAADLSSYLKMGTSSTGA